MYPIIALSALRMGASVMISSAVVGVFAAGKLVGSVVGGALMARRGASRTAVIGLVGMAGAACGCAGSGVLLPFIMAIMVFGVGHSIFHIARQAQAIDLVHGSRKARALTTLAGMWRISNFIGPAVGAMVIHLYGLRSAYVLAAVVIAAAAADLVVSGGWHEGRHHTRSEHASTLTVVRENRHIFSTLGVAIALTTAVRNVRLVAIPLWADHLGLPDSKATAIFAVSAAVDMLLFYPAGSVSDRWGRRWSAVPSNVALALGFLLLPLSTGAVGLTVAAIILGVGNGWGSGLVMTLGADIAPSHSRSVFLGLWMVLADIGLLTGPVLVSLGALVALPVGIAGVGAVSLGSMVMLQRWIPPGRAHERGLGLET